MKHLLFFIQFLRVKFFLIMVVIRFPDDIILQKNVVFHTKKVKRYSEYLRYIIFEHLRHFVKKKKFPHPTHLLFIEVGWLTMGNILTHIFALREKK